MAEDVAPVEQVDVAPAAQEAELPAVTADMRAAFAGPTNPPTAATEQPAAADQTQQPAAAASAADPAKTADTTAAAAAATATAPDYTDLLKELGVENVDDLKSRWNQAKEYDPAAVEKLKANQRDAHDEAVRNMLATDPEKARAYFDLQALPVDALATGTPEQQRQLLFEQYKLANPELKGRLAELGFNKEFTAKYAYMGSEEPDESEEAEFAKLQYESDLKRAAPAVKAAQEAAKIAAVPAPVEADKPTPEQQEAFAAEWLSGINAVLAQPKVEQVFQTENGPVTVGYNTSDADLKAFLDKPLDHAAAYFNKIAYPNGFDKPADMAALAQAYLRLTKPEAIATAAAAVGKASVGAHVPMEKLVNHAPEAPLAPAAGGEDQAGAIAAIRAVAQGRR